MDEARPDLAISYFQRLYVMHGRWRDWVAKTYYRSGEAFEKLDDYASARRTYQELAGREDIALAQNARPVLRKPPGRIGTRPSSQWMPRTDRTIRGSLAGDARRWMPLAGFRLKSGKQVANQNFSLASLSA
jgi:hypothetical protein